MSGQLKTQISQELMSQFKERNDQTSPNKTQVKTLEVSVVPAQAALASKRATVPAQSRDQFQSVFEVQGMQ